MLATVVKVTKLYIKVSDMKLIKLDCFMMIKIAYRLQLSRYCNDSCLKYQVNVARLYMYVTDTAKTVRPLDVSGKFSSGLTIFLRLTDLMFGVFLPKFIHFCLFWVRQNVMVCQTKC
ncbi:hypothetical protein ACF0H5_004759 [Mactra antiquata]